MQFSAPVEDAAYRDWRGSKLTDVALGMAGSTQVELIHVHHGHDAVEAYQAEYGTGFQHLGIGCRSRDRALAHLMTLGAELNESLEMPGLKIAFVDGPTGPALFELLESTGEKSEAFDLDEAKKRPAPAGNEADTPTLSFPVDRATLVTRDMAEALAFHSGAFGWTNVEPQTCTLRHPGGETRMPRARARAGTLEIELIAPDPAGNDPYAAHLRRGTHGLVHAGGQPIDGPIDPAFEWLEEGERFSLSDWAGGPGTLQGYARA